MQCNAVLGQEGEGRVHCTTGNEAGGKRTGDAGQHACRAAGMRGSGSLQPAGPGAAQQLRTRPAFSQAEMREE